MVITNISAFKDNYVGNEMPQFVVSKMQQFTVTLCDKHKQALKPGQLTQTHIMTRTRLVSRVDKLEIKQQQQQQQLV
jgi:hypothetical protein